MLNSTRRIRNIVSSLEEQSDRVIAFDSYYIVKCQFKDESKEHSLTLAKQFIKKEFEGDSRPLIIYIGDHLYILFSSLPSDKNVHFLKGRHQSICSFFSSHISSTLGISVECNIIEIESKTSVYVYFQSKIYSTVLENAINTLKVHHSDGFQINITSEMSLEEMKKVMKDNSIQWEQMTDKEKYGVFYKYSGGKIKTKNANINIDEMEKFKEFIFAKF